MIYELFKDSEWSKLLAMADPTLDPFGSRGSALRKSINSMLTMVFFSFKDRQKGKPEKKSFSDFALAGEVFIRGMRHYDFFMETSLVEMAHWEPGQAKAHKPIFDKELADRVQHICNGFRVLQAALEWIASQSSSEAESEGPNSKPWLHYAVARLYDLWCDELGQEKRLKKDFLAFAYAVLAPARMGVTEYSIEESFDRHVRSYRNNSRAIRQLKSI